MTPLRRTLIVMVVLAALGVVLLLVMLHELEKATG